MSGTMPVHGRDLTPEQMIRVLDEHVNANSSDCVTDEQRGQFARTHRTLQRGIFCYALQLIELMATVERTDLRNEWSKKSAQELIGAVDWLPEGRPPLV